MKKKRLLQIVLPVVIIIIIAGIWVIKNKDDIFPGPEDSDTSETSEETDHSLSSDETSERKEIIPLEISEVDMTDILSHGLPVIIDFGSESCAPCIAMAPALEAINEEMQGKAIIHFLNTATYPEEAMQYPVQLIPTQLLFYADGSPYLPGDDILARYSFTYYSDRESGEHVFTAHVGGLTEEDMRLILSDMGA